MQDVVVQWLHRTCSRRWTTRRLQGLSLDSKHPNQATCPDRVDRGLTALRRTEPQDGFQRRMPTHRRDWPLGEPVIELFITGALLRDVHFRAEDRRIAVCRSSDIADDIVTTSQVSPTWLPFQCPIYRHLNS
jgi:hypothetical protein